MATKTIRICDVTGEELTSPVNIGFTLEDGTQIIFEINQKTASKFVLALARRLPDDVFLEVVEDFFGKAWNKTV